MKTLAAEEEQFLTDAKGRRTGVLLNMAAYERLRQAEEDLADLRAYDSSKARAHSEIAAGQSATLASYSGGFYKAMKEGGRETVQPRREF